MSASPLIKVASSAFTNGSAFTFKKKKSSNSQTQNFIVANSPLKSTDENEQSPSKIINIYSDSGLFNVGNSYCSVKNGRIIEEEKTHKTYTYSQMAPDEAEKAYCERQKVIKEQIKRTKNSGKLKGKQRMDRKKVSLKSALKKQQLDYSTAQSQQIDISRTSQTFRRKSIDQPIQTVPKPHPKESNHTNKQINPTNSNILQQSFHQQLQNKKQQLLNEIAQLDKEIVKEKDKKQQQCLVQSINISPRQIKYNPSQKDDLKSTYEKRQQSKKLADKDKLRKQIQQCSFKPQISSNTMYYKSEYFINQFFMFQKFGQQLKPIINRSSSENKKEQPIVKPNYHFTQKRDRSESRVQQSTVEDQHQNNLKPQSNLIQSVPAQRLTIKLPDLKGYQKQMEKSMSGADLTKKPPLLKNRLILDSKSKQQPQGQQSSLTQTLPIKSQREENSATQQQRKNKIKITHYSQSRAGFDGIQEKTNQDRELCLQLDDSNYAFAVMDGHGMDGEYVSSFIKELLKYNLTKFYKVFDFQKVFFEMHQKMKFQTEFGCQFSGSTLTVVLIRENSIHCGWVGDSRAILVKKNNTNNNLNVVELSVDHKPHLDNERQRIEQNGGVVDTYHLPNGAPIGPSRVWARGAQFPGLAMSRSLGDTVAAAIGVSQTPDIKSVEIDNKEDIFIVLGSDGIWEFLDNQSIAELVYPFYQKNDAQGACQKIIQESVAGWKAHSEGIDDITAIVIFFQYEL